MHPPSRIVACVVATGFVLLSLSRLAGAEINSGGKHCLWRITNARAPFFLVGSVHSLQRSDYDTVPAIEQAIRQSQKIVFEVDPKEDAVFATKLRAAARLPRGEQIKGEAKSKDIQLSAKDNDQWHGRMAASLSLGDRNALELPTTSRREFHIRGRYPYSAIRTPLFQEHRWPRNGGRACSCLFRHADDRRRSVFAAGSGSRRGRSTAIPTERSGMESGRHKPALRDTRKRSERSSDGMVETA